ncbi:thioesterase domain-containing protein, partial [Kitasatospora sp. NPDC047058]|uniref:thioesterase domain-containing protein n=1 Tax=Kitasatospora sp. NPDC047058 TaxID=3155620 RepID=UPI0033F9AE41
TDGLAALPTPPATAAPWSAVELFLADVRRWAARSLPEAMLPAQFAVVDSLPLTLNGKLDRAALPPPRTRPTGDRTAPRDLVEAVLCGLFAEVLGAPGIGVHDDFFALGGSSFGAIRLLSRVRAVLGGGPTLRSLFAAPTVAAFARALAEGAGGDPLTSLLPLRPGGTRPPLFCVHPAAGAGWVYAGLLPHLAPDRPLHALQDPALGGGRPAASVEELAERYVRQIRAVQPDGPYHLAGWSFGGLVAQAVGTRLRAAGEAVDLLALLDAHPLTGGAPGSEDPDGLRALLESLGGHPPAGRSEALDLPAFRAAARGVDAALAELDDAPITAMAEAFRRNVRLAHAFRPAVFDGDLLLFTAARGSSRRQPGAEDWTGYVTGRIDQVAVACAHGEMAGPGPMAVIGPRLAHALSGTG